MLRGETPSFTREQNVSEIFCYKEFASRRAENVRGCFGSKMQGEQNCHYVHLKKLGYLSFATKSLISKEKNS